MCMRRIKIIKDFYKPINFRIKIPTIRCICGEQILYNTDILYMNKINNEGTTQKDRTINDIQVGDTLLDEEEEECIVVEVFENTFAVGAGMSFSKISEILNLSDRTVAHKIYKGNKDYVELDYITGEENKGE